jgi:hypothetical protein
MSATPVVSRAINGSSNGAERAFRHSPYRNVRAKRELLHLHKAQCLKNLEVPSSIHDNMRALGAQLFKGERLARLVGKSPPRLRVGK